jgi:hypothetical protein
MQHTRFIGLDVHKERISVAVAEGGRSGTVEYLGEIANEPGAISKLCERLGRAGKPLVFCSRGSGSQPRIPDARALRTEKSSD